MNRIRFHVSYPTPAKVEPVKAAPRAPRVLESWTPQEDEVMRLNYKRIAAKDLAAHLGRTKQSVCNRATRLGLSSPRT